MSLNEYVRKRKFEKTPEPAPSDLTPEPTQGRFFIQRHDATRLHYDFRLEIAGTLKSWAVPKGPSLLPLHKGLAMHVEDHPLDYGDFEGNIPKGNYGGGSVMLWDRGTFDLLGDGDALAQIERGDLKFRLHGEKINGEFALVRMKGKSKKGNEWLLIKKRDEYADENFDIESLAYSVKTGRTQEEIARDLPGKQAPANDEQTAGSFDLASLPNAVAAKMPSDLTPMMAVVSTKPPEGKKWIYEIKWDGVRALCYIQNGKVRMVSRNGNSFDRQYPELSVLPHAIHASEAILDGEIAVVDEQGRARFSLIQPRIHQTDPNSIAHLARRTPARFFAFDLVYCDGFDLRSVPLLNRKEALEALLIESDTVKLSRHFSHSGEEMLEAARQAGIEGIMAKLAGSKYEAKRSESWRKIKITSSQDFVICGFTLGERSTFSSLILGAFDNGKLVYTGNVGTGFNEASLDAIYRKLLPLKTSTHPFAQKPGMIRKAVWVRPELVCECKFSEWTPEGRLRAPVFLSLRADKKPEECALDDAAEESAAAPEAPSEVEKAESTKSAPTPRKKAVETPPQKDELFFPARLKELTTTIDGRPLKFTNLDKVYYPKDGCKKRDVLNYYDQVSELIVPYLKDRPLSLKRYPNGIHEDFFFQKDTPDTYPDWLRIEPVYSEHRGEPIRYVVADDRSTLLYLVNLGCIDQNPWMSRVQSLDNPDYILIDLDPQECSFDKIVEAAQLVKEALDEIGLQGFPKTTGGDGMHVFVPLQPVYTYEQVRSFAEILSQLVVSRRPELFTTPRSVAKRRKNRVYFDFLQISSGKTIAAPYVLRAYDGAPVAAPLDWEEVKPGLRPQAFHIGNAVERFRQVGDLFAPVLKKKQKLEPALKRLAKLITS